MRYLIGALFSQDSKIIISDLSPSEKQKSVQGALRDDIKECSIFLCALHNICIHNFHYSYNNNYLKNKEMYSARLAQPAFAQIRTEAKSWPSNYNVSSSTICTTPEVHPAE